MYENRTSMTYTFLLPLFFLTNVFSLPSQNEYQYLDLLALNAKADKASSYHNYTEVYARYFKDLRDLPIKFLEIGIWKGYSVKLWEDYFKNAELHFLDISLSAVEYTSSRSHYHLADQSSVSDLEKFIAKTGGQFDVIIDDGGHTMEQQITSFCTLFPHVKKGGIYIIEDLHTSYWPVFVKDSKCTTVEFLKTLIDDVNFVGATTAKASHLPDNIASSLSSSLTSLQKEIESIHFYDSLAIIIKRDRIAN